MRKNIATRILLPVVRVVFLLILQKRERYLISQFTSYFNFNSDETLKILKKEVHIFSFGITDLHSPSKMRFLGCVIPPPGCRWPRGQVHATYDKPF